MLSSQLEAPSPSGTLRCRILESIDDLSAAAWNSLSGHQATTLHGYLFALEQFSLPPSPRFYFIAEDEQGLAGAMVGVLYGRENWVNLDKLLFGQLEPLFRFMRLHALPALLFGPESGMGEAILLRESLPREAQQRVSELLIRNAEEFAAERGFSLGFRNVGHSPSAYEELLSARGFLRTSEWPQTYLDLPGPSFQDYRHALRKTHPSTERNLSREIRCGKRAGLEISFFPDPASHAEQIHRIMDEHYRRLNGKSVPYRPEFFRTLCERLPHTVSFLQAKLGDELVGASLMLKHDNTVLMPMIGFDRERGKAASVYFNLGYNAAIALAAEGGFSRVFFGRTVYGTKVRRGCQILPLHLYLLPSSLPRRVAWSALFPLRDRILQRRLQASIRHGEI